MTHTKRPIFPFTALQGQTPLQTALLLATIDPLVGGVLIQGPRGSAKSTSARALTELLPTGHFVDLPLGASEEQLIGSLDIEAALKGGDVQFQPGLLAKADQGVLYVDEVNLLADHLVDLLLDVSACGVNVVERDGISHQHESRFVLVGTMNPEEGELRPQLLDRFGLQVSLPATIDVATRQHIVRSRLQFDTDPYAFVQQFQSQQSELQQQICTAQSALVSIQITDNIHQDISELCAAAGAEGVRGDLALLRASRAHAALQQRDQVELQDIEAVADWVLDHRRKEQHKTKTQNSSSASKGTPTPEASSTGGRESSKQATPKPSQTSEDSKAPDKDNFSDEDWGAMPAEKASILPVKKVRPLSVKKL